MWGMSFYGNPSLYLPTLWALAFCFLPYIVGAIYWNADCGNEMQIRGKAETQMFPHCLLISYSHRDWQETFPFRKVIGGDE